MALKVGNSSKIQHSFIVASTGILKFLNWKWNFSIVLYFFAGFLTLPTAYVTGNPVECVIHPEIWNKSKIWDPQAVGQIYEDQYEEEYVGYPIESVSTT